MITMRDTPILCFSTWRGIGIVTAGSPMGSTKHVSPFDWSFYIDAHSEIDGVDGAVKDVKEESQERDAF